PDTRFAGRHRMAWQPVADVQAGLAAGTVWPRTNRSLHMVRHWIAAWIEHCLGERKTPLAVGLRQRQRTGFCGKEARASGEGPGRVLDLDQQHVRANISRAGLIDVEDVRLKGQRIAVQDDVRGADDALVADDGVCALHALTI